MNSLEDIKYRARTFGQSAGLEDTLFILSIIEQVEKALEKIAKQEIVKISEPSGLMATAAIKINSHRIIAEEALQAIKEN